MMVFRHEEDGAVAIVTAITLIVLLLLAAFLVDLGGTRADARADQLLADSSVMAAALMEDSAQKQCEAAVAFYAANISAPATGSPDCASVFPEASWKCDDPVTWTVDPPTAVYVIGSFTMEVTIPVPGGDSAMTVSGQLPTSEDGNECDRIKVSVQRTRDYAFGGAAGVGTEGGSVNDAVAIRFTPPEPEVFPSLIVLEEKACDILSASGGGTDGQINIKDGDPWDSDGDGVDDVTPKGIITVDTTADGAPEGYEDGQNCGAKKAVVLNGGACIRASGDIFSFGMKEGDPNNVYDGAAVDPDACVDFGGGPEPGLWPEPEAGDPVGRKQVDWRFNCMTGYPKVADPSAGGNEMRYPAEAHAEPDRHDDCPEATERPAFIDELFDELDGGPAASLGFISTGTGGCPGNIRYDGTTLESSTDGGATWTPYTDPHVAGRVRIECDVGSNDTIELEEVDYVFFDNPISASTAELTIHGPDATGTPGDSPSRTGAVVYFPDSGIESIGDVELWDVFVYVDDGYVAAGDNDELTWNAMFLSDSEARAGIDSDCAAYVALELDADPLNDLDLPSPGCFAPLALWSNGVQKNRPHKLGGGGDLQVAGTFFTPNAEQELSGGGAGGFTGSQFYANILRATGGAQLIMQPSPNSNLPEDPLEPALIR